MIHFLYLFGFALLAGLFTTPAALIGIMLYAVAVSTKFYIFGNFENFMALISLLILGTARPGIDDLFGIPHLKAPRLASYVPFLLRIGIGGAFVFLALYEKVLNPHLMEQVVLQYRLNEYIPVGAGMWVFAVGTIELLVGICILIGFQTRLVSAIGFAVLITTFFFFKEDVYSHVTLFGVLSAIFITGAGRLSLDSYFNRRSGE